jgi:hypothetical protein
LSLGHLRDPLGVGVALAAFAERVLESWVRARDVTVEGDRDIRDDFAHLPATTLTAIRNHRFPT